jgi:putative SOS response-associated peptidase YedK
MRGGERDFMETSGAPGRPGIVIRHNPKTGERRMDELIWGLLPHDTTDPYDAPRPIHARAETVHELPTFADAFRRRRAIIPADQFFLKATTDTGEKRFAVSRADGKPMAWAGLWESYVWADGRIERTYCVVTVPANGLIAPLHDRMPLVLEERDWPVWLGETPGDPVTLLHEVPNDVLRCNSTGSRQRPSRRS